LTLSYRQGYFARSEGPADSRTATTALQKAGCEDYLNATSILLFARNLPSDSPEQLKYLVAVAPSTVTFVPAADGTEEVKITLAVCTFDKAGKPLQFMTEAVDSKLNPKEYQSVLATKGFPHVFTLVPKPRPASVRLLVKDESTGRIGSVNIPILANSPVVAAGKGGANASAPAP
jgi:hypothetical protein